MNGHGEKLTRKQDAAIDALLSQPTISAAAQSVGIGEATLRRWLKEPGFLGAYRTGRRDALEHYVALLQRAGSDAVEALQQSLQAHYEGVRLRAACAILDYNLGNFLRRLALPEAMQHWTLTSLQTRMIKTGGRLVRHARRLLFQMAEVLVSREMLGGILERISQLRLAPG